MSTTSLLSRILVGPLRCFECGVDTPDGGIVRGAFRFCSEEHAEERQTFSGP